MPTDTDRGPTAALRFALAGVAWSLGLFAVLRFNWTEAHIVLPFTRAQASVASALFGAPSAPVEATLACSGTDALALCVGAVLAYPAKWRVRLSGAVAGAVLVLGLNTLRISTLGQAAASPAWFTTLHLYVWPALLTVAIAGFVFAWMRFADGTTDDYVRDQSRPRPSRRFVVLTAVFLLAFVATSPIYLASTTVRAAAGFVAQAAAAILSAAGFTAHAASSVVWTPRGAFLVTPECIVTPLIPVYVAAICAYATSWRRLVPGLLVAVPLFLLLGIARMLVVALPGSIAAPVTLVHAFSQLLLGVVAVCIAAVWRHGGRSAPRYALAGVLAGVLFMVLLGPFYTRLIAATFAPPIADPQGAIALLPAFQVGLYLGLCVAAVGAVGWRLALAGLGVLAATQGAGLLALDALATSANAIAAVANVRAWAVAGPVVILMSAVKLARPVR